MDPKTPPQQQPPQDPAAELAQVKKELERFKELAARAQADLQNAKGRVEKEREEVGKFAIEAFLTRLLPTLDNFQRAFEHLPDALKGNEWVKGVTVIEQDLLRQMEAMGLKRMRSLGQPLDPARHEILMTGPGTEGTVVEVFEEGYELHGKVLRHAKVKAGDGSSVATTPTPASDSK